MKAVKLILIVFVLILLTGSSVSAEKLLRNPSVYSIAEIVQELPKFWDAYPADVLRLMEKYPDFDCWRSQDLIGCASVNNKFSADINVNYQFTSKDDTSGLFRMIYSMEIESAVDVQNLIEAFWLPGMAAANISGGVYPKDQIRLYFSVEDTLMMCQVPLTDTGGYWYVTIEMGVIRG